MNATPLRHDADFLKRDAEDNLRRYREARENREHAAIGILCIVLLLLSLFFYP